MNCSWESTLSPIAIWFCFWRLWQLYRLFYTWYLWHIWKNFFSNHFDIHIKVVSNGMMKKEEIRRNVFNCVNKVEVDYLMEFSSSQEKYIPIIICWLRIDKCILTSILFVFRLNTFCFSNVRNKLLVWLMISKKISLNNTKKDNGIIFINFCYPML